MKIIIIFFFIILNHVLNFEINCDSKFFSTNTTKCICKIEKLITFLSNNHNNSSIHNLNNSYIYESYLFSGKKLFDLGSYSKCNANKKLKYLNLYINYKGLPFTFGLCTFYECSLIPIKENVTYVEKIVGKLLNITIDENTIEISNPDDILSKQKSDLNINFIFSIVILLTLIGLNLISIVYFKINTHTSLSLNDRMKNSTGFLYDFLSYFHFFHNLNKIIPKKTHKASSIDMLNIFDGVRFFSALWVLTSHSFVFLLIFGFYNINDMNSFAKSITGSIIISGYFAVDVFFYLSGFMLYLYIVKYMYSSNKAPTIKVFVIGIGKRFFRLLPLMLFTLYLFVPLLIYFSRGPNADKLIGFNQDCNSIGWRNVLYISNFFNDKSQCAGHMWYLTNDMQFYIFFMGLLMVFTNKHKRSLILLIIFISSIIYSIYISIREEYGFNDISHMSNQMNNSFFIDFYIKPWIRVNPYIIGIFSCEFYINSKLYMKNRNDDTNYQNFYQKINEKIEKSTIFTYALLTFSIFSMNFSIFSTYITNNYKISMSLQGIMQGLNKDLFVFGLSIMIHLCFLDRFTFIHKLLSFRIYNILGKFTFGLYLIHIYILGLFYTNSDSFSYFNPIQVFIHSVGIIAISFLVSIVLSLIIESPVVRILSRFTKKGE